MDKHYHDEEPDHVCLECGKELGYGRKDRKFCSERCRNSFNNTRRRSGEIYKMHVVRILTGNYQVLESLLNAGITETSLEEIAPRGFRPEFMTSHYPKRNCSVCTCYDVSYSIAGGKIFNIRRLSLSLSPDAKT